MSFSALDSALTGPLFASAAMREAFSDRARATAMLRFEAALARAQGELGLAPAALAPAIEAVDPDALDLDAIGAETAGAGVPSIPFLQALKRALPAELAPHLHKGATTQDVLDTALVLQARAGLALLDADLARAVTGLARLARAHRETPCIGRTYGQHAAPVTFGFKAAVWALGVAEARNGLREAGATLTVSLGGAVGTLAALGEAGPEVAARLAAHLGFGPTATARAGALGTGLAVEDGAAARPDDPALPWHARRARIAGLGAALGIAVGALAKLATDVVHLASTEVGEVAEPHAPGRGGSSAMPHKRNPVSATVILAAHAAAPGHVATLLGAMAAAHERPAGLWHAEWHALPTLFGLASGAAREGAALATGLEVDPAAMRRNLELTRGLVFADAAGARLAPLIGGEAPAVLGAACARVRDEGLSLREALDAALHERRLEAGSTLDRAFDPASAVEAAARTADRMLASLTPGDPPPSPV